MESSNEAVDNGLDRDRISELPDPILHQILSPFRTKHALRTVVLSRRWRDLWASMPYFYLDDYKDDGFWTDESNPNFVRYVDRVLLCRNGSDIHTFHLRWDCGFGQHGQHHLDTWTEHVVKYNVKVLELGICITYENDVETVNLPSSIFTSPSVEQLKLKVLGTCVDLRPPGIVMLNRLRKMVLEYIYVDRDSLRKLLSGCPVLEDLQFQECRFTDPDITSNVLKRLDINNCSFVGPKFRLSVPNLRSLCFKFNSEVRQMLEVLFVDLSSLVDASIELDSHDCHKPFKFTSLTKKCNSKDLGPFRNLKKLELSALNMKDNFEGITYFLQNSPKLELLTLRRGTIPHAISTWVSWVYSYDCPHLKMEIHYQCEEENDAVIDCVEDHLLSECDCS